MANKRKEIREYIVTQLEAAFGTKAIIYNARYLHPKAEDALQYPVISVFTPEDASKLSDDDSNNERTQLVEIIMFITGDEEHEQPGAKELNLANRVDTACAVIEDTLGGFRESFNGLIFKNVYKGTKNSVVGSQDSGYLIGVSSIKYDAIYHEELI